MRKTGHTVQRQIHRGRQRFGKMVVFLAYRLPAHERFPVHMHDEKILEIHPREQKVGNGPGLVFIELFLAVHIDVAVDPDHDFRMPVFAPHIAVTVHRRLVHSAADDVRRKRQRNLVFTEKTVELLQITVFGRALANDHDRIDQRFSFLSAHSVQIYGKGIPEKRPVRYCRRKFSTLSTPEKSEIRAIVEPSCKVLLMMPTSEMRNRLASRISVL